MRKLTKKQDKAVLEAKKLLWKTNDPDLQFIARHLRGGLEVVNYLFDATNAAQAKVPKQYEVRPVTLTSTNKTTMGNILAAQWLLGVIQERLNGDAAA